MPVDYTVIAPGQTTFTETWLDMSAWYVGDDRDISTYVSVINDATLTKCLRIAPYVGLPSYGAPMRTKQHWNKNKPINVKAKVRATNISGSGIPWCGVNLYSSEAEYWGLTWKTADASFCYYYNASWISVAGKAYNTIVYDFEIDYDPARNPTTIFKINGTQVGTLNFIPTVHPSVWLGGTYGESGTGTGYADFGGVIVVGEPVFGSTDSGISQSWAKSNASHEAGTEFITGSFGQMHFYTLAGGMTLMNNLADPVTYPIAQTVPYPVGAFSYTTPVITCTDYQFDSLKLVGSTRSGGTLKVQIYRSSTSTLVSESELPGNSAGFTPTYQSVLSVSLLDVVSPSIYAVISGSSPAEVAVPLASANQPNVGPPILKALTIEPSTIVRPDPSMRSSVDGTATLLVSLGAIARLTGQVAGTTTATADTVTTQILFAGDIRCTSSISGGVPTKTLKFSTLPTTFNNFIYYSTDDFIFDANISSSAVTTGDLTAKPLFAADAAAASTLSATITTQPLFSSAFPAQASYSTAALTSQIQLMAASSATSAISAQVNTHIALMSSCTADSAVASSLSVYGPASIKFEGSPLFTPTSIIYSTSDLYFEDCAVAASSSLSGDITTKALFVSNSTGTSTTTAAITTYLQLSSATTAVSTVVGGITTHPLFAANISGASTPSAGITTHPLLSAGSVGSSLAVAAIYLDGMISGTVAGASSSVAAITAGVSLSGAVQIPAATLAAGLASSTPRRTVSFFTAPTAVMVAGNGEIRYSTQDMFFDALLYGEANVPLALLSVAASGASLGAMLDARTSTLAAGLATKIRFDGALSGQPELSAAMQTGIRFAADLPGHAAALADLQTSIPFTGSLQGLAALATDDLFTAINFNGNTSGWGYTSGTFAGTYAPPDISITGSVTGIYITGSVYDTRIPGSVKATAITGSVYYNAITGSVTNNSITGSFGSPLSGAAGQTLDVDFMLDVSELG